MHPKIIKCRRNLLDLSKKTCIMGVLNVTPDSFADGGKYLSPAAARRQALLMEHEGADIIDIGGESSRPGSRGISADEELKRILPVLKKLRGRLRIPISVDTTKYDVARRAISEGASIINDISGVSDIRVASLCAAHSAGLIIMHMKGTPRTMQEHASYKDVTAEISSFLLKAAKRAAAAGVNKKSIIIDPGIGFGKTLEHNLEIIRNIDRFKRLGFPVLIGLSRKSFLGKLSGLLAGERLVPTVAAHAVAVYNGADIIRAHDVKEAVLAAKIARAIKDA